jgi:hypothetical protein
MPRKITPQEGEPAVVVVFGSYLRRLKETENSKPPAKRRPIPTMKALAEELGVHQMTLSDIANSRVELLNLTLAARLIAAMRRRGFPMEIGDMLEYREPEMEDAL